MDNARLLRFLRHNLSDRLMLLNAQGEILYLNHAPPGLQPQEILRHPLFELVAAEHQAYMQQLLQRVFASAHPQNFAIQARSGHDRYGWFSGRLSPVVGKGRVIAVILLAREQNEPPASAETATDNLLTMCAWTRKIRFNGEWVSFETFLWERFGLRVSHGISEEALLALTVRRTE